MPVLYDLPSGVCNHSVFFFFFFFFSEDNTRAAFTFQIRKSCASIDRARSHKLRTRNLCGISRSASVRRKREIINIDFSHFSAFHEIFIKRWFVANISRARKLKGVSLFIMPTCHRVLGLISIHAMQLSLTELDFTFVLWLYSFLVLYTCTFARHRRCTLLLPLFLLLIIR